VILFCTNFFHVIADTLILREIAAEYSNGMYDANNDQWMHPVIRETAETARAQLTDTYRIRSLTMSCNFAAVRT